METPEIFHKKLVRRLNAGGVHTNSEKETGLVQFKALSESERKVRLSYAKGGLAENIKEISSRLALS